MESIKYIAQNQRDREWGLAVCSVGHQKIAPGEEYPPQKHNPEYMFDPSHGRVLPEYQNNGIGGMLLREAHGRAAALGYGTAVLLGHKDYYPRFGYCEAAAHGIKFPFNVPFEYCQVIELIPGALKCVNGMVHYPAIFFE